MKKRVRNFQHIHLEVIASTNLYLKQKITDGELSFAAVSAGCQLSGKGRSNRKWESPHGGLYLSIATPHTNKEIAPVFYSVAVATGITELLRSVYSMSVSLKWPNDFLIDSKKIGGMLSEFVIQPGLSNHIIVGIGLNVNESPPIEMTPPNYEVASLIDYSDDSFDIEKLTEQVIQTVLFEWEALKNNNQRALLDKWQALSETVGKNIELFNGKKNIKGICVGVDNNFNILISQAGKTMSFSVGDCYHLKV